MNVFVYGTLTDSGCAAHVLDEFAYRGDAILEGLHCVEGAYPTLAPSGEVEGRLLQTEEMAALDAYEGVDRGLYACVSVPLADEPSIDASRETAGETVAVYVGDPEKLDARVSWPGIGPFATRVERYVCERSVCVRRR